MSRRRFKFVVQWAEASALALAANIARLLDFNRITFLTEASIDKIVFQMLVNFFNGSKLDSPPHWEIKPFIQRLLNEVSSKEVQVMKIQRSPNITAHALATEAFHHHSRTRGSCTFSCSNVNHHVSPSSRGSMPYITRPFLAANKILILLSKKKKLNSESMCGNSMLLTLPGWIHTF